MGTLSNDIEENTQELAQDLDNFLFESEKTLLTVRKPGVKLQHMLEDWQNDINEQCWSKDELDYYKVSINTMIIILRVSFGWLQSNLRKSSKMTLRDTTLNCASFSVNGATNTINSNSKPLST